MGDNPTPTKKPVSTRLPADDYERLEAYCEDQGISQSDALRRFITTREHLTTQDTHRMGATQGMIQRFIGGALLLLLLLGLILYLL